MNNKWLPIDQAPKDGRILGIGVSCDCAIFSWSPEKKSWMDANNCYWYPTHFMLLPEPPKQFEKIEFEATQKEKNLLAENGFVQTVAFFNDKKEVIFAGKFKDGIGLLHYIYCNNEKLAACFTLKEAIEYIKWDTIR